MTSTFNVQAAGGYEQLMGRWSKRLAPLFVDFAGLRDGEKILDVGCGTGSLTFEQASVASLKAKVAPLARLPLFGTVPREQLALCRELRRPLPLW